VSETVVETVSAVPTPPVAPRKSFFKELAERIDLAAQEGQRVRFIEGSPFHLVLGFPKPQTITDLFQACSIERYDPRQKQIAEKLDNARFAVKFADLVIKSWDGLDRVALEALVPVLVDDELWALLGEGKTEIPYSSQNAQWFVTQSSTLQSYCQDLCTNAAKYNDAVRQAANENLRGSSGGSTPIEKR